MFGIKEKELNGGFNKDKTGVLKAILVADLSAFLPYTGPS